MVSALAALLDPVEQSQAQLVIDVYPSQDNPTNQTLWIFSGNSSANDSFSTRTSSANSIYSHRDTWRFASNGNLYDANNPSRQILALSPLFSSSNTADRDSVLSRIPGGGKTNITFASSATNTPMITIGSGNQTISHFFMDNDSLGDALGIRTSSSLSYAQNEASSWVGAGIINKPIGDFHAGTFNRAGTHPWFGNVRTIVHSQVIPEPKEYALIFGLFALGFVFFHRRRMQKKRQQATAS